MSRKIYTYKNIHEIKKCPFYNQISECPQITVTTDLRKGINWFPKNHNGEKLFSNRVFDFGEIFEKIDPEWNSSANLFSESITVSEFIRNRIDMANDTAEITYLKGVKRNSAQIVRVVNFLEESNVNSEQIRESCDGNKDILTFCDTWDYLYEENSILYQFNQTMKKFELPQNIDRFLSSVFGTVKEKKIVLHGFYYISGLQKRIFDAFEKAGYNLIFLIQYFPEYPTAMEPIDCAYSPQWGFEAKDKWILSNANYYNAFGELLEGRTPRFDNADITITQYDSILSFAQDMRAFKDKGEIYSSNSTLANKILKEFYPERYGERRLLSYPVGQFLVSLHSMWDEDEKTIVINSQLLKECFASGWLSCNGVSSIDYLRELDLLLPYFVDCKKYYEWEKRLLYLKDVYENAIQPFYDNLSSMKDIRVAETSGNPFTRFGMFSVDPGRIYDITTIIEHLINMAKELFLATDKTSIGLYMTKLEKQLKNQFDSTIKTDSESLVVGELMNAIVRLKHKQLECHVDDIVTAIHIYLNNSEDDEENRSGWVGMVYPILQIDAAMIKHGKPIHLCLSDINNMPGTSRHFEWPLNMDTIEKCARNTNNMVLSLNIQNYRLAAVYNRYYFFSAFNNDQIDVSWVKTLNNKICNPSPYIKLLETYGIHIGSIKEKRTDKATVINAEKVNLPFNDVSNVYDESDSKDMKMEYALCPMRYVYGFILDTYPKFVGEFQNSRAIGGLIAAIYSLMKGKGYEKKQIAEHVFSLFPQIRNVEKKQILDYVGFLSQSESLPDEYDGYEFTAERFKVSYPDSELLEAVRQKYGELNSQIGRTGVDLFNATDVKKSCVLCPHESYCRNCIHALDQEDYYEC